MYAYEVMAKLAESVTLRFVFISDADKPVVSIRIPGDMPFMEALAIAARRQGKEVSQLAATFPGGTPIVGGTVDKIAEKSVNIHVIDPSIVG